MDTVVARRAWQLVEPLHAIVYFAPETRAETDALGLRGGWMSYFGCRAAPMGAVSAAVVTAVFYNFNPAMVERAIPDAWGYATPAQLLDGRLRAVDAAMTRLLGEGAGGEDIRTAAALAAVAAAAAHTAGRPLSAANAALATPRRHHLTPRSVPATRRPPVDPSPAYGGGLAEFAVGGQHGGAGVGGLSRPPV